MPDPSKNTRVYRQVVEQIKQGVEDGSLKKGDRLPSERLLVEQQKISRASVREAIRALEIIGLVECRHGGGNYIKADFQDSLLEPLSILFMLEGSDPREIWELRKAVEIEAAGLAAKNITPRQLSELQELTEKLVNSEDEEISAEIDKKFHYKIAEFSGNILIFRLLCSVSTLVDRFIKDARKSLLAQKKNKSILCGQHLGICRAIEHGQPADAQKAMRRHLDFAIRFRQGDGPAKKESPDADTASLF